MGAGSTVTSRSAAMTGAPWPARSQRRACERSASIRPPRPPRPRSAKGVETVVGFFGREARPVPAPKGVRADLMCANNVLAHVPDLDDFVGGFAALLADDGLATLEFPMASALLRRRALRHHLSRALLLSVVDRARVALRPSPARIRSMWSVLATHGGSARLHVRHAGAGRASAAVAAQLAEERAGQA